jgi:hypothetical protein
MYEIQVFWSGVWITVQTGFKSRDAAEWATAQWKQANQCFGDPFRAIRSEEASAQEIEAAFAVGEGA